MSMPKMPAPPVVIDPIMTQLAARADMWVPVKPPPTPPSRFHDVRHGGGRCREQALPARSHLRAVPGAQRHREVPAHERPGRGARGDRVETASVSAASSENKGAQVGKAATTTTIIDHPAVLDADGAVKSLAEAADPQLNGTYDFNGVPCSTAYDLLLEEEYAPGEGAGDLRRSRRDHCGAGASRPRRPVHPSSGLGFQLLHQRRARGPRQHHHGGAHGSDRLSGRGHGRWRLQGMLGHQRGGEG
ncbi:MAG: hypothetical protein ACLTDR_15980 [Adlercreutzia equolifaciens]